MPQVIADPLASSAASTAPLTPSQLYGLNQVSATPTTTSPSELNYQDIDTVNSPFLLVVTSTSFPLPLAANLLEGPSGTLPSFTLTLPQQLLPGFALQASNPSFENAAFYADSRRTYFVVNSPLPANAALSNANALGLFDDVSPQSFYFFNHYHPWVGQFIKNLNWNGISSLMSPTTQSLNSLVPPLGSNFFDFILTYVPSPLVNSYYPQEVVDFNLNPGAVVEIAFDPTFPAGTSAYAIYNWEIFFHIPLLVAIQLSQNQQFDDAETWFRYIFNPTQDPNSPPPQGYQGGSPNSYWNFKPFNMLPQDGGLAALLASASGPNPNPFFYAQMNAWEQAPFEPDIVAQFRQGAYQKAVVMKYLDHLIRRGDYCFSQNTRESINESIQYYILADQILGKKPVVISQPGIVLDQTYYDLLQDAGGIYGLGNANVQLENAFPFVVSGTVSTSGKPGGKTTAPTTPYFCTPNNPTLLSYYDTVADRLYKIRHCMNIQGQIEQLPLFSAPIDPGLLVAAEAAGVDLSSVLNDISAAVPHYRFSYMLSKALELCAEVRSLGAALLSALEKSDAEYLSLLRAGQEVSLLQAVQLIKQLQIQEANANYAGLQATQAVTTARQSYYQGLVQGGLSGYEMAQVAAMSYSEIFKLAGSLGETGASALALVPQFAVGINGAFGSPSVIVTVGGSQYAESASAGSRAVGALAEASSFAASMAGLLGSWDRRGTEWEFQLQTATLELAQIAQQLSAANFRVQIATQDLSNQALQIANAQAVQSTLQNKFTNQQLYQWMVGQVSAVFFQCYQMAYDLAKRAEACYRFELGVTQSGYIQFGYWDSMKKGLMAGEKLFQDLKRLEVAYIDQNQREYELSKSISLLALDPWAFVSLKLTGLCLINLPEALFDMDYPGHYLRRIRNVSLTIPCVTGPYTTVNYTLTLLQSRIRINNNSAGGAKAYAENPSGSDGRFAYNFSATESIATSTAQNDSGLFEVNFRDERYLPFEGSGVISQWQIEMPPDCNAFDFETISNVILNLRYSARNGGDSLRQAARAAAVLPAASAQAAGTQALATVSTSAFPAQKNLQRYFSLRHEFPNEWYKLLNVTLPATDEPFAASMQIQLGNDRFPFQYRSSSISITAAKFVVVYTGATPELTLSLCPGSGSPSQSVPLNPQPSGQPMVGFIASPPQPTTATQGGPKFWTLGSASKIPDNISDILMVCTYSVGLFQ